MPTDKQSAASRANAQKSTGPRTEFGKASSRFNALKHGIDAQQQIMLTESASDLAEVTAEYHELYSPVEADLWSDPDATAPGLGDALKTAGPTCALKELPALVGARHAWPSAAAAAVSAPQPAESKTTSESSASFPTNTEAEPEAPENPAAATQPSLHEQGRQPREPIAASDPTFPPTVRQC